MFAAVFGLLAILGVLTLVAQVDEALFEMV